MSIDAIQDETVEKYRLLAAEADHRLLNNLQAIASLLALQSRQSRSPDSTALDAISQRVMALQRIHKALRSTEKQTKVDVKSLFSKICSEYVATFGAEKGPDFSIFTEGDELFLDSTRASTLATACNELLMNAIKYGEGNIRVELKRTGQNYMLSVASQGGRLPEGFEIDRAKGLGMRIVKALVQKLKGALNVEEGANGVPVFRITIPMAQDS